MKPGEKGYTLIEMLVAIPIIAVASIAAGEGIIQIIRNNERNSNHMAAVLQVENSGSRISYDIQRAQGVTVNQTLPKLLVLSWIDGNNGNEYQITYTLENMSNTTMKALYRNQSINGGANTTSLVAQYVDSNPQKTSCTLTNGILSLTVTATEGGGASVESETRIYQIVPRPD
jgi:prepilin-type N-terminal cleavage/methylation domain-containing protein